MRVIHLARKPLSEKTVAANVLKHGTGAINVDASRTLSGPSKGGRSSGGNAFGQDAGWNKTDVYVQGIDRSMSKGRWPANLILQHRPGCRCVGSGESVAAWLCEPGCPVPDLDEQTLSGGMHSAGGAREKRVEGGGSLFFGEHGERDMPRFGDSGGASRFFKEIGGLE